MSKVLTQTGFLKFVYESATARLTLWDDGGAHLTGVYARIRGKGHATKLLGDIVEYADAQQLELILEVSNYGPNSHTGLNNEQLEAFYGKFDFVAMPEAGEPLMMKRTPSQ